MKRNYIAYLAFVIFFLQGFIHRHVSGVTYFISNSGLTTNTGTTSGSPWPFSKVNSTTFAAGDVICFNKGETFTGSITCTHSGTSGNQITYTSYGTGAAPVITGFVPVTSWTNLGGSVWESTLAVSALSSLNMVTINGVNTGMGRTPNTGLYYTNTSSSTTTLTDATDLNAGTLNWTGATAVIRKSFSSSTNCSITAASGSTLSYTDPIQSGSPAQAGYGFFIQNDVRTLDVQNEWFYNTSTKKIRIFSATSPTGVQVAAVNNLVTTGSFTDIAFDGLKFTGANNDAFPISSARITVKNCTIDFSGQYAFEITSGGNDSIYNSIIDHSGKGAVFSNASVTYVGSSQLLHSGIIQGQSNWDNRNCAIFIASGGNNPLIEFNTIIATGCHGISMQPPSWMVRFNTLDSCVLVNNDNGALYGNKSGTTVGVDRNFYHNIVKHVIGNDLGTPNPGFHRAVGIYLDESVDKVHVVGNTIYDSNTDGIKIHISFNNRLDSNTVFNCTDEQLRIQGGSETVADTIRWNIFFAKSYTKSSQLQWCANINSSGLASMGPWDNNYYIRPTNRIDSLIAANGTVYSTFSAWQSAAAPNDANSHTSPLATSVVGDQIIVVNPTSTPQTTSLAFNYMDPRGTTYNGSITVAPYSSAALIKNGPIIGGGGVIAPFRVDHNNILN